MFKARFPDIDITHSVDLSKFHVPRFDNALESFARAAALELERGLRVNTVSPIFVKETMEMMGMDPASGLSAADTAKAYEAAVEGEYNGATLSAPDYA